MSLINPEHPTEKKRKGMYAKMNKLRAEIKVKPELIESSDNALSISRNLSKNAVKAVRVMIEKDLSAAEAYAVIVPPKPYEKKAKKSTPPKDYTKSQNETMHRPNGVNFLTKGWAA